MTRRQPYVYGGPSYTEGGATDAQDATMSTFYTHMASEEFRTHKRDIALRESRTFPEKFDIDVSDGRGVDVTIFSLTPEDVRRLGQQCSFALAELVVEGHITQEWAEANYRSEAYLD